MSVSEASIKGYNDANDGNSGSGNSAAGSKVDDAKMALYTELWKACAPPSAPCENDLVFYYPHGQIEQVEASTNQSADQQMPFYNVPSKILCRVVNVTVKAKPDTGELCAHITLLPMLTQEPLPVPPPRFHIHFCKTTASDTMHP